MRDVGKYVDSYNICQRIKNRTDALAKKLKRKDTILVVYDKLFKMTHFVATIKETLVKRLVRLFRDNIQKLHRLPKSVVSDRGLQFVTELTKELNKMLGIEIKLLTSFYPQTDSQIEQMNQELEQYLWFFINHRQKDWLEWLATVEFAVNNKIYSETKMFPFITNYSRELRMGADMGKKGKMEKMIEFVERIKKVQEKV